MQVFCPILRDRFHRIAVAGYTSSMGHRTLRDLVDGHAGFRADADGFTATAVPGVSLFRATTTTALVHVVYKPVVCLILQGAKQVTTGATTFDFKEGQSAIITADMPALSRVSMASRERPYLSVAIDLDVTLLLDLAPQIGSRPERDAASPVLLDETDAATADAALRLVRLLERSEAIPVLRPIVLREFHYWLMAGRHGNAVRHLAAPESQACRIARAISVLRAEFDRPLRVERLAGVAGMSLSSFHQHFRANTSLSPIQFQKRLRLIEARRLMMTEARPINRAAFDVGYESVQQSPGSMGACSAVHLLPT